MKPGGMKMFGLDFESLAAINPRLVYLSISGFGTKEGAWLPGYDLVVQAVSGLMSLTGEPDGPPYRAGISVFDVMTGLHGTIGVLAALNQREQSGLGQHGHRSDANHQIKSDPQQLSDKSFRSGQIVDQKNDAVIGSEPRACKI